MFDPFQGLNDLLARYADACPTPEPSANFMPGVWRKIEARRGFLYQLQAYSRRMAATAAAFSLLLIVLHFVPMQAGLDVYNMTYMDALEEDSTSELMAYAPTSSPDSATEDLQ